MNWKYPDCHQNATQSIELRFKRTVSVKMPQLPSKERSQLTWFLLVAAGCWKSIEGFVIKYFFSRWRNEKKKRFFYLDVMDGKLIDYRKLESSIVHLPVRGTLMLEIRYLVSDIKSDRRKIIKSTANQLKRNRVSHCWHNNDNRKKIINHE